jgi:hypothetical protein
LDGEMSLRQHLRDLAHAGLYMLTLAVLLGGLTFVATAALTSLSGSTFSEWSADPDPQEDTQENRISRVVANARQIQASLANPIPGPGPLPPITAKIAYGHLKPGAQSSQTTAYRNPKIPKAALDAMAMDRSSIKQQVFSAPPPELHKVY